MANDTGTTRETIERDSLSHPDTDSFFATDQQDSVFDDVQLAQAAAAEQPAAARGAPQQVAIPAGADVVRVAVGPGAVLVLGAPFTDDAEIIGRIGDGNLAIRVGDVTVILEGYVDANQQAPVVVQTADSQPIDIAVMLASTDPAIDIQTAAGPGDAAAGPQGADNSGGIFSPFGPGSGLGGFTAVGAQAGTELSYGLIDATIRLDVTDDPTPAAATPFTFSFIGPAGPLGQAFLRDPANSTPWSSYQEFAELYFSEGQGNWADFFGTMSEAPDYLESLHQQADIHTSTSPATVLLAGIDNIGDLTSNGEHLFVVLADGNQTAFIYREGDHALVAVLHVTVDPGDPTTFHIDSYLINRIDDLDGSGEPADASSLHVSFQVYGGEVSPNPEQEGALPPGGLPGTAVFEISDDNPLMDTEHPQVDAVIEGEKSNTVSGSFHFNFGADGPLDDGLVDGGGDASLLLSAVTTAVSLSLTVTDPDDGGTVYLQFEDGALVFSNLTSGTSLVDVVQTQDGAGHTILTGSIDGGAVTVFVITVTDATGAWTFELVGALDHPDLGETGALDPFRFALGAAISDDDRDVARGSDFFFVGDSGPTIVPPPPPPPGDDQDPAAYAPGTLVHEAGLESGSDPAADSETTAGTVTILAKDGVSAVTIAGIAVDLDTIGNTPVIHGTFGDLTVTGWNPASGELSYSYTLNQANPDHSAAAGNDIIPGEDFTVVATDGDGDPSPAAHIVISIVDDVPTALDDALGSVTVDGSTQPVGNILANDGNGADGGSDPKTISAVVGGTSDGSGGWNISLAQGTVHVAADGSVSFAADPAHDFTTPQSIAFDYTIVDGDGDASTATVSFAASAPRTPLPAAADLEVDESQLADGSKGGGGLLTDSKTVTLPDGFTVTNTGTHALPNGTLTVSQSGQTVTYKYDLGTAYDDGTPGVSDGRNLVGGADSGNTFDLEVEGPFGQTGSITVAVAIKDDVASAFDPQDQSMLNSPAGGVITGGLDIAGHTGADGYGAIVFSGGTDNSKATLADGTTPLTWQGKDVLLAGFGTATLTGYVDLNGNKSIDAGETVFTVTLDGPGDSYAFTLVKDLDDGARVDFTDLSGIDAGKTEWIGVGADAGDKDSRDLLYTPLNLSTQDINTSSNDIGSSNQWIDAGEGVRLDFVKGLTGVMKNENDFSFASHYQVQDFQIAIGQVGGGGTTSVKLTAWDVTNQAYTAKASEAIFLAAAVVALTAGELQIFRGATDITASLTITYTAGSAVINGLQGGDVIQIHESSGFDRLSIDSTGGTRFSVTGAQVLQTVSGNDLDLKFETTLADADGDTAAGQYIGINLQTNDGESHKLGGGVGDDTIVGGSGSDYIFGDVGNDTLLYDGKDTHDGGDGFDRVLVTTGGNNIIYDGAKFLGIEMFDLGDTNDRSGSANQNTLALDATDVVGNNAGMVAGHEISFFVIGDTSGPTAADRDNVILTGFGAKLDSGSFVDPVTGASHDFDIYASTANPAVKVAIEQGLDVA
jgi:hypothetical protein